MKAPIEMTELEFQEHLEECVEAARKNGWQHVIEELQLESGIRDKIHNLINQIEDLL